MTTQNQLLTENQRNLLTSVLNCIIPPQGDRPGAGDLQVADFVEGAVSKTPQLRRLFIDGLAQVEITAAKQANTGFTGLSAEQQEAALREVQSQHAAFFDLVLRQCYNGYYTNPQVQEMIGYQRPSPEEYEYKPLDESLLEPQKQRAPFWTQV